MKTITIVSNNFWTVYKFRLDVISMLLDSGYHINIIAGKDSYIDKFKNLNIILSPVTINERGMNFFQEICTFMEIYRNLRKNKPSLVFNFTLKANIYSGLACRILNLKYISMITGLGYIFVRGNILIRYLVSIFLSISLKKSSEVWFTNKFDESSYKNRNIITSQLTRIVPGAGAVFDQNETIFVYNKRTFTFVMISRLLKEKGVSEYIEAAEYYRNNKNMKFILLGSHKSDKNYISKRILQVAIDTNAIEYYDYQEDITAYLKKCTCIVQPSYREGLSTILLEASALRKPIITTKVPGCIDIIPDESYGTLCEPADTRSLIKSINRFTMLSEDTLAAQTSKTYDYVKKNYNRSQILDLYKESLKYII